MEKGRKKGEMYAQSRSWIMGEILTPNSPPPPSYLFYFWPFALRCLPAFSRPSKRPVTLWEMLRTVTPWAPKQRKRKTKTKRKNAQHRIILPFPRSARGTLFFFFPLFLISVKTCETLGAHPRSVSKSMRDFHRGGRVTHATLLFLLLLLFGVLLLTWKRSVGRLLVFLERAPELSQTSLTTPTAS